MKAYLQTPCCGEMIEVEADTPEALASALAEAMITHYQEPEARIIFEHFTMESWWNFAIQNDLGFLVENDESIEDEYKRVMRGKNIIDRTIIMVMFGMFVGLESAYHNAKIPDPIVTGTDPSGMMAFESGFMLGTQLWTESPPLIEETSPSPMMAADLSDRLLIEQRFLSLVPANDAVRH